MNYRIGQGFDSHRFCETSDEKRPLILGGTEIPFPRGLAGHSDADALIHAIIDSLLGATGMSDIGELFPPSDSRFKNISSVLLLKEVIELTEQNAWKVINNDCTIICEKPKISDYKTAMISKLANAMKISQEQISLKGKTAEKMGALGREEGIAVIAIALLEKIKPDLAE